MPLKIFRDILSYTQLTINLLISDMLKPIYWIAICLLHPIFASLANYRLPTAVRPEHYKLEVLTHLGDDGFKFFGKVWIKV